MKVTPASSAAPNTVTLTSTYSATNDPTITHASSLKITATPVPNSGGSTVTATIPLTLSQPWIYAADNVNKDVEAFDEQGHAKTLAHPITGMNDPFGVVYDYGNGLLYVADYGANTVTAYHPDGTPYALSAPLPFAGLNGPAGLEYDPTTNSIYVVSFAYGSGTVSAFDEQGNPKDISGFGGINAAYAITHNPNNDWFYVANCTSATTQPSVPTIPPGSITTYDAQGVAQSTSGGFPNLDNPDAIAYDAHNGWLYIGNDMTPSLFGTIAAYDEQGHQQTLAGNPSGIPTGWGLAYDQNNGSIYVAVDSVDESTPTIWSYDEAGFKQTTAGTFPGLGWPAEISVVP
jgi:DNA-binding beta-propeller fold protein YncE